MKRKKKSDEGLIIWAFIIGLPAFLIMLHPIIFWTVFIPVVVLFVMKFLMWLKKR